LRNFAPALSFWRRMSGGRRFRSLLRARRATLVAFLCVSVSLFLVPAAAPASSGGSAVRQIFAQCTSGHLSGDYTVGQLQQALSVMPASVSQYTSCPDVVQTALIQTRHHLGTPAAVHSPRAFVPAPVIAVLAVLLGSAGVLGVMALRRR
jgi:hypothetical protein